MKNEQDYFNKIKEIIENTEVNKKIREYKNNYEDLVSKWNIGKLLTFGQFLNKELPEHFIMELKKVLISPFSTFLYSFYKQPSLL